MHVACDLVLTSKSTISHVEGLRLQFLGIDITNAYSESILYQLQMTEVNNNGLINSFNDAAIRLFNIAARALYNILQLRPAREHPHKNQSLR